MTYTDEQVAQYFAENPGLSENQIAQVMRETGVSPEQVARVTGADPGYVSQRYLDLAPPPAPVDPNVEKFNSLIREGKFGEAGVLATNSGFTPEQVLPYLNDPNIFPEFGGNVTLDTVKSFVPEDKGIATVLPDNQGTTPLSFTDQLNALFQTNLGRLPTEREASIYSQDFGGTFSPELEAAFMSRSTEEMGNRQKGITEAADAAAKTETAKTTAPGVYQPTYTSYRQEGQAPFGGYYALPGISPYGGVFGVGTEQFEQQSDPFSGAQARAQEMIRNRISPSADPLGAFNLSVSDGRFQDAAQIAQRSGWSPDAVADYINANRSGLNLDSDFGFSGEDAASFYSTTGFPRQPAPFGGYVAANDMTPNPFAYRQTLSPRTLTAPEAAAVSEAATPGAAASEVSGRRGGYVDQGIAAVRR